MTAQPRDTDALGQIIEDLYAGTLDELVWDRAIVRVADLVRASGAILYAFNPSNGAVLRSENYRIDLAHAAEYGRHWTFEDSRRMPFVEAGVGVPVTEQILTIPGLTQSRFYNEFLLRVDMPHFMPVWLHKSSDKAVALAMQAGLKRGPFQRHELELYSRVIPHLSRALEIRDRMEAADIRARTLAASLDGLSFGICVLGSEGRVLEANAIADPLLSAQCGIGRRLDGTIWLQEPAGNHLKRWLKLGAPPADNPNGLLHVARGPQLPLTITIAPFPAVTTSWMHGDPRWLLLIFDPELGLTTSRELIARDLGLTAREAEVACLLLAGGRLTDIARRLSVSWHTIRAQLQSIFRKTGVQSQAELVKRMMLGPSMYTRATQPCGAQKADQ